MRAPGALSRNPAHRPVSQPLVVHSSEELREGLRLVESGATGSPILEAVHAELLLAGFLSPRVLAMTPAGERFLRSAA
jgi:deoxyribodipyrimidine photolyase